MNKERKRPGEWTKVIYGDVTLPDDTSTGGGPSSSQDKNPGAYRGIYHGAPLWHAPRRHRNHQDVLS